MKKLLLLLSLFICSFTQAQTGLLAGTGYAPNFTVTDINGTSHTLYNYLDSGKVVVLELLSVTCGHCQQHAAGTENSYIANGPSGSNVARFLGLEVNASTNNTAVANFATTYGASFPIANNVSPTAINYQLYYTPGYFVIYPDRSYTTICAAYCVTAQNYTTIEGLLNSAIASWIPLIYGCTNPLAVNYDSTATIDNDSCDFTSYTITTVGMSFSPDTIICDVGDTINFILGGYHNAVEVSDSTWLSGGTTSNGGFSFGFGATGMFIPDQCHTYYYVCQPHASSGMKGVIIAHHTPVYGCTDSTALNYDSTATIDDGTCCNITASFHSHFDCDTIDFVNTSISDTSIISYSWDMGGTGIYTWWMTGDTSANPEYVYDTCGTYTVSLTIIDANGCVDSTSISLQAPCRPIANFSADTACFGDSTYFIDLSSGGISVYYWYFGDGWDSSVSNPTHWYAQSGIYTVSLTVIDTNWCWDTFSNTVYVDSCGYILLGCTDTSALNYNILANVDDGSCWYCDNLSADFYNNNVCQGFYTSFLDVSVAATTIGTYQWDMGGPGQYVNGTNSSSQNPEYLYDTCGTYNVSLIVNDINCSSDTITRSVLVLCPPTANFTSTVSCLGTSTIFTNLSVSSSFYPLMSTWYFGDGNTTINYTQTVSHIYSTAGTYTVILIVFDWLSGCTDSIMSNILINSCTIYGCTDSTALNYNPLATVDDGSCQANCGAITGVNLTDVIHDRAVLNWDDMNTSTCIVDQIRIRYREVGTSAYSTKTMGAPVGNNAPCLNTSKRILNLSPSTQYLYNFKIWYQDGTVVTWHAGGVFTTALQCDNAINVIATPMNATKTNFCWTAPSTPYSFVRLKYREDVPGSTFSNIGGMGVLSPALCKEKNGIATGLTYRVMWRSWCNPSGGPYRSAGWDGPVTWTQTAPIRVEGGTTINNLDVYPNPSRDIFNVTFTSEDIQNLEVRIINVIGEVVYTENLNQFVGEYTKQVDLSTYTKGVYFLEITTNNGVINKKLILQ